MKFPASYYLHDRPNVGIEYNNTQSEDISIGMLFQGKPFGHQLVQDEMVNRKKKTIVINDWNPKHLENRDFRRYIDELI